MSVLVCTENAISYLSLQFAEEGRHIAFAPNGLQPENKAILSQERKDSIQTV